MVFYHSNIIFDYIDFSSYNFTIERIDFYLDSYFTTTKDFYTVICNNPY